MLLHFAFHGMNQGDEPIGDPPQICNRNTEIAVRTIGQLARGMPEILTDNSQITGLALSNLLNCTYAGLQVFKFTPHLAHLRPTC